MSKNSNAKGVPALIAIVVGLGFGGWFLHNKEKKKQLDNKNDFENKLENLIIENTNLEFEFKNIELKQSFLSRKDKYNKYNEGFVYFKKISGMDYANLVSGKDYVNLISNYVSADTNFETTFNLWAIKNLLKDEKYGEDVKAIFKKYNIDIDSLLKNAYKIEDENLGGKGKEILKDFNITKVGIEGENRVIGEVKNCRELFEIYDNIRLMLGQNTIEFDCIIVAESGIFIFEIKNYGENKKEKLLISKDGKWTRIDMYGHEKEGYEQKDGRSESSQLYHSALLLENHIKSELGKYDININNLSVSPYFVIPNNNLDITDESNTPIIRQSEIYRKIFEGTSPLSKEQREAIKRALINSKVEDAKFRTTIPDNEFYDNVYSNYQLLCFLKKVGDLIDKCLL